LDRAKELLFKGLYKRFPQNQTNALR